MAQSTLEVVLGMLGDVNSRLAESAEGQRIFAELEAGNLDLEAAALQLAQVAQNEGLMGDLRTISAEVGALAPGFEVSPAALREAQRPVVMQTSTGIDQMNPVLEAALAEMLSLDGDVPTLRTGSLPPEGCPAVPVLTDARDPAIIGLMLEKASNEVRAELTKAVEDHTVLCERLLEVASEEARAQGLDVPTALTVAQKFLPAKPIGVPGYQAGQLPALREVEPPSPLVVGAMNPHLRQIAIYKVLSTSQGRRSAASVVEQGVREALEERGIPLNPGMPDQERSRKTCWAVQVFGPEDLSDQFNPIQTAIDHLAAFAVSHATSCTRPGKGYLHPDEGWAVQVSAHNDSIASRRFGWDIRIGPVTGSSS